MTSASLPTHNPRFPFLPQKIARLLAGLALCCLCAPAALAQVWLQGRVVEDSAGVPFASIQVRVPQGTDTFQTGASANANGDFRVRIPGGPALVTVTAVGYEPVTVRWQSGPLRIHLVSAHATTSEVELLLPRAAVTRPDRVEPVEAYRREYLQSIATPGLIESLRLMPGVQAQNLCNVCNTTEIRINGLDGPYTQVTIDGIPMLSALGSVYGLNALPVAMIERVELQRGPGSVSYGSEAIAGVVNLQTVAPARAPRLLVDTWHDSYGQHQTDVVTRVGKPEAKVLPLFGISAYNFNSRHDVNRDGFLDQSLANRYSLFGKVAFGDKQGHPNGIFARYLYENRLGGEYGVTHATRGTEPVYSESIYTRRIELAGTQYLPTAWRIYAWYGASQHAQNSYYGTTGFMATQRTAFAQLMTDGKSGDKRHEYFLGAALRYNGYTDNTVLSQRADSTYRWQHTTLPGLLGQYVFKPTAGLQLLAGLRTDWHPVHGAIYSPRVNARYNVTEDHTLRLGSGRGFRVVNLFTEEHSALTGSRTVVLPRGLQPERSLSTYAQYDAHFHTGDLDWTAELGAFYTRITDKLLPDYSQPDQITFANISGLTQTRGLYALVQTSFFDRLEVVAGGTWLRATSEQRGQTFNLYYAPRARGNLLVTYRALASRLTVTYSLEATGPMRLPVLPDDFRPEYSPIYSLHDVQATWRLTPITAQQKLEVYAGVRNLWNFLPANPLLRPFDPFDKNVDDPVGNPNGYTFDTAYNYAPLMTRRVHVGVRWRVG